MESQSSGTDRLSFQPTLEENQVYGNVHRSRKSVPQVSAAVPLGREAANAGQATRCRPQSWKRRTGFWRVLPHCLNGPILALPCLQTSCDPRRHSQKKYEVLTKRQKDVQPHSNQRNEN